MNKLWVIYLRDQLTNLLKTILTLVKVSLHSKISLKSPLEKYDKYHSISILGNGPSLENSLGEDHEQIKNSLVVCVNNFPKTEHYQRIQPDVFIFCDHVLWLRSGIRQPLIASSVDLFNEISKKTNWPLLVLAPFESRSSQRWQNILNANKHIKIAFYNNTPIEGWNSFTHLMFRWNLGMPRPHNVLIPSIFLSINSQIKKIFLYGVDHNWLPQIVVDKNNRTMVRKKHFSDSEESKTDAILTRGKTERKLWEILENYMVNFKGYLILEEYAKNRNTQILNATPNSFIDAFKRITE